MWRFSPNRFVVCLKLSCAKLHRLWRPSCPHQSILVAHVVMKLKLSDMYIYILCTPQRLGLVFALEVVQRNFHILFLVLETKFKDHTSTTSSETQRSWINPIFMAWSGFAPISISAQWDFEELSSKAGPPPWHPTISLQRVLLLEVSLL